ncbi:MAG: NAD(P)/FAD-dependent oxidoreductase [Acidobacteriaceae bacterium]
MSVDVVILGAGAAGLLCAIEAGQRGRRVLLLDHADRPGKKILISGGGRCNFTNLHTQPENFLSANPHFAKSALARYTPADFLGLVEKHRIPFHEKTLGQLFCDHSAQAIVTMLSAECDAAHVKTVLGAQVTSITKSDRFLIESSRGSWHCSALVIATGGLSIPKMGATGFGYTIAKQFGVHVLECRPALVPFVLGETDQQRWCDLTGLSTEVIASAGDGKQRCSFREKLLLTHRGLSGPVVLQTSSYWRPGESVTFDLAPGTKLTAPLRVENALRAPSAALSALRQILPGRFAERWLAQNMPPDWTNASLDRFEQNLHRWQLTPEGTEGFSKAEVTAGGVDTAGLNARTMESTRAPGLYFIGEVVDVTGWLGGYNFQWAWASGAAAGRSV